MNLNDKERKVLRALARIYNDHEDFVYLGFKSLSRRTKLPRADVRRAARSLRRKGLTQFMSGLCTEDGDFAGSGYACTGVGFDAAGRPAAAYRD